MARNGSTRTEIASTLGIHPNTITDHLALRVPYPQEVLDKLGCRLKMPEGDTIPLYDSSIYLPGWPSRCKMHALKRAGVLRTTIQRNGAWSGYVVTRDAIKRAAQAMLPDGLWFRSDRIQHYAGPTVAEIARSERIQCKYWPSKEFGYVPACTVQRIAKDVGATLAVPAVDKHRALATLAMCSVATIG